MNLVRTVIVLDAADLESESHFWAKVLNARVLRDDDWHSIVDDTYEWRMGIQLNPNHVRPEWPTGNQQQQIHIDLHVEDPHGSHNELMAAGATVLEESTSLDSDNGHRVYADPAGHPFCMGWGHPTADEIRSIVKRRFGGEE